MQVQHRIPHPTVACCQSVKLTIRNLTNPGNSLTNTGGTKSKLSTNGQPWNRRTKNPVLKGQGSIKVKRPRDTDEHRWN